MGDPTVKSADPLIPNVERVRYELCRAAREQARLRSLLRLAIQAHRDREFLEAIERDLAKRVQREKGGSR